jgi:hypothetical protein
VKKGKNKSAKNKNTRGAEATSQGNMIDHNQDMSATVHTAKEDKLWRKSLRHKR